MGNKKLIYFFGAMFSILFAVIYFFLFDGIIAQQDAAAKTIYFNQVGLYKSSENSKQAVATLEEHGLIGYAIAKTDVTAVVCSVSEQEEETKKDQETLTNLGISYIEKNVSIEDPEILKLWSDNDIVKALEMMNY